MINFHTRIWGEISFYRAVISEEKVFFEAHEHYQKRSSRNRYKILSTNGILNLSIPLKKGKNSQTPIKEVKISYDENWVPKHLNAIRTAYASAPYFHHLYPKIEALYLSKNEYLFDLNTSSIKMILEFIQHDIPVEFNTKYEGVSEFSNNDFDITPYPQVFEYKNPFEPIDSMLDLVFCLGPESILYL